MARQRFSHSLGHRADQAGIVLAGANVPLTFQRTLMPRPTVDQALVTGRSLATAVIEEATREIKADGGDPNARLAHLVRNVASAEFGASGGASVPADSGESGSDG